MFRNRPVSLALVGLFVWVTGCSTYTQIEPNEVADHYRVRVTTTGDARETIEHPRIEDDRIVGESALSIPLDQVAEVEAVGQNTGGTVVVVVMFAGLILSAIAFSGDEWR